jgi:hypothetical protein
LLNTFEDALHSRYLCLIVSTTFRIISVFGSQKDAKNIEQGFMPNHKNVQFVREESDQYQQSTCPIGPKAPTKFKKVIEVDGDIKNVALDPTQLE